MKDTPLAAIEIEIQLIPGFTPRSCGTFRGQQKYVNPNSILYKELLGLFFERDRDSGICSASAKNVRRLRSWKICF